MVGAYARIGPANCRPASPLNFGRQFVIASCGPPSLSAVVVHLWRLMAEKCGVLRPIRVMGSLNQAPGRGRGVAMIDFQSSLVTR